MNKEFVSYDIALTLKELGFDETCLSFYNHQGKLIMMSQENEEEISIWKNSYAPLGKQYAAPLQQQCFKWFRKKYGLMHIINPYDFTAEIDNLKERIVDKKYGDFIPHHHIIDDEGEEIKHSSYEEAEGACLDKLIEIVKDGKYKKT